MNQTLTSSSQPPLDHSFSADAMKAAKPSASKLDGTRLNAAFDYLENVAFAATICDKEGIVLYQNAVARQRDGEVIGKNLYNCHSPKSDEKIRMMMETGMSNSYEVIHHGKHYFIHHTPWFAEPGGEPSGLIELDIEIPDTHPTFNRDKE